MELEIVIKNVKKKLNFINHKSKRKPFFVDYPIFNYDIIKWIKYLDIKNFKGLLKNQNLE